MTNTYWCLPKTYWCLLPLDLKIEIGILLHRHYFSVVLQELLIMTMPLRHSLDIRFKMIKIGLTVLIRRVYSSTQSEIDADRVYLPRWDILCHSEVALFEGYNNLYTLRKSEYLESIRDANRLTRRIYIDD
jgi:hypothetical protein